jgi:Domain of unknown function (DUF4326)
MTDQPRRVQRPWIWRDRPDNVIDVTRATRYGNPFTEGTRTTMVDQYRAWIASPDSPPIRGKRRTFRPPTAADIAALRGHDLACFCPLDGQPCHADVLLGLAKA